MRGDIVHLAELGLLDCADVLTAMQSTLDTRRVTV